MVGSDLSPTPIVTAMAGQYFRPMATSAYFERAQPIKRHARISTVESQKKASVET